MEAEKILQQVRRSVEDTGSFNDPSKTPIFHCEQKTATTDENDNIRCCAVHQYLEFEQGRMAIGYLGRGHFDNKVTALNHFAKMKSWLHGKTFAETKIGDFETAKMEQHIIHKRFMLEKSPTTASKKITILQSFCKWAVKQGYLKSNPLGAENIELPPSAKRSKRIVRLSREIVDKIIKHAEPGWQLKIKFAAQTGLRASEQWVLEWDDIDFKTNHVHVRRTRKKDKTIGDPKTEYGIRRLPIGPDMARELKEWKLKQPVQQRVSWRTNNLVFPNAIGGIQDQDNALKRRLYPACKAAGVDATHIDWHSLRHFYASVLIFNTKLPFGTIAKRMGHHDSHFTWKQYGIWWEEGRNDDVDEGVETENAFQVL